MEPKLIIFTISTLERLVLVFIEVMLIKEKMAVFKVKFCYAVKRVPNKFILNTQHKNHAHKNEQIVWLGLYSKLILIIIGQLVESLLNIIICYAILIYGFLRRDRNLRKGRFDIYRNNDCFLPTNHIRKWTLFSKNNST